MFGHPKDPSSTYFSGQDTTGDAYWQHQAERHAQHRRSVIALTVAIGTILLLALVIHPDLAWCAAFLVPFVLIEWGLARRSRSTTKIPDYRPADTVIVPLDPE